jgi:SRSO17 transposase
MAEASGDKTPYSIQQFIYRGNWSADELMSVQRDYVKSELGCEDGVYVVDETGFLKKGTKSAGVARQYSGTAGKVDNCQIGVFLTYSTPKGFAVIDRGLYLPKEWTDDRVRCAAASIPDDVRFKTKPQMALDMMKSANESGVPFSWVTGDSVYGDARYISQWLESIEKGYVLAVSGKAYVWRGMKQHKVAAILTSLPVEGWQRLSAGEGTKGERYYDWITLPLNRPPIDGWNRCLLIRRSISNPDNMRPFICCYPVNTNIQKLVQIAGLRWTVEQSFEETKGEVGLDHYEVRSYHGWYKHISLACCAHALLAVLKLRANIDITFQEALEPGGSDSMATFKKGRGI